CWGRERPAIADGGRRRGADRRGPARTGRRSAELAQRLPRPHARHAAWLAQSQDPEAAGRQLLPAVPGGAQDDGKGVGRRHPGGLDRRRVDAPGRRDRAGDGALRHLEEPGLETVQGNRRAREGLPRTAARRRLALSVAGCDLKVREGGRIVSVAAIIAVAANTEGRREIVGLGIGPSEAETFWADFLKRLTRRGLRGVKLVISDAHEGLKAAVKRVVGATWQRCRVHFMRNALVYVPKTQETVVAAAIRQAFIQPDRETAGQVWRHVADQLRPRFEKLGRLMDEAEHDVLAYMTFAAQHRTKLHSTNPLERLNKEVKRRADVVGIFPNEESIVRLVGAVLMEQNDDWQTQNRYMQIEGFAEPADKTADLKPLQITPKAALTNDSFSYTRKLHHIDGPDPDRAFRISCSTSVRGRSSWAIA